LQTGGKNSSITSAAPYSALQFICETNLIERDLLENAAKEKDSMKRLAMVATH